MADNQLDILIKFGLSKEKATEAAGELKKIKEQTTETGKEGVKQEAAVEEATKKTFASKKQLKDILKQIGHEFPILGSLGRLAINPIALAAAGCVAAFTLWRKRTDELAQSLGGIEMPDVRSSQVEIINNTAAAYGRLAEKMREVEINAKNARIELDNMKAGIKGNAEFMKALGINVGNQPERAQADATATVQAGLRATGERQLAAAGNISADNPEIAKLAELAKAAEAEITKSRTRLADIGKLSEINHRMANYDPRKIWGDFRMQMRYGRVGSYSEAEEIERNSISQQQTVIDRYRSVQMDRTNRLGLYNAGKANIAAADAMTGERRDLQFGIASSTAKAGMDSIQSGAAGLTGALTQFPVATRELLQGVSYLMQAIADLKAASQLTKQISNQTRQMQ
jgi:hypothetical protein